MKTQIKLISILLLMGGSLFANDGAKEHGQNEEAKENSSVGADKGIFSADDHVGFQLSPEAIKNFAIESIVVGPANEIRIPASSILLSGEEKNIYRIRENQFKRVDFTVLKQSSDVVIVKSHDLKPGDRIVTTGVPFLRIAEITAFGGAETSHSH